MKKQHTKKDFLLFAQSIDLPQKSAEKMIAKIVGLEEKFIQMCPASYMPDSMKNSLELLIRERMAVFKT